MISRETPGRSLLSTAANQAEAHRLRTAVFHSGESADLTLVQRTAQLVAEHIDRRQHVLDTIHVLLRAAVPAEDTPLDALTARRIEDLHSDILAVRVGVEPETGVTCDSLRALRGLPGIDELEQMREQLQQRIAELAKREATTWPRPFRYIGPRHRHDLGGRYARPGEVIELTETQASGFAERFEPVEATAQEVPASS